MKDPYLIPSQICEVWNGDAIIPVKELYYFSGYGIQDELLFGKEKNRIAQHLKVFEHYRPIGTEWDFAPDWALDQKNKNVCSTVDADGKLKIWDNYPKIILPYQHKNRFFNHGIFSWTSGCHNMIVCGKCPDKVRYEGEAWKTSLRMRPEWAMKKDNG